MAREATPTLSISIESDHQHLSLPATPRTHLNPTYPKYTDKGIKLGFRGGPLLWQGETVVSAGTRRQPMSRSTTLSISSRLHSQAQA